MTSAENKIEWTKANTIALVAVMVAAGALAVAYWQYNLAQKVQDRAAGKVATKFEFIGVGNTDEKSLAPFYKKSSLGVEGVFLQDVKQMIHCNPYVEVKNTGDEIIDGLRVEVRFSSGMIVIDKMQDAKPTPYVLSGATDLDLPLKEKLRPGQKATVSIMKPILGQLLQEQAQDRGELEHVGHFEVTVYCKAPGGTTAGDRPEPYKFATLHFIWLPKGFTKEACKDILDSQPQVMINGP